MIDVCVWFWYQDNTGMSHEVFSPLLIFERIYEEFVLNLSILGQIYL